MKTHQHHTLAILVLWLCSFSAAFSAGPASDRPFLHPIFNDHAVFQREVKVPVWGWAGPGTAVTVTFAGQKKPATAGADGKWLVHLEAMPASAEPRVMSVVSSSRTNTVTDVLVGDVWLCSGQSNMEMGVENCNVPNEIAAANYPNIRLLTVPKKPAAEPQATLTCQWFSCNPATIKLGSWGGFSATAYFFGRDLHRELNIPIGLIHSSWGGTIAESWTSAEGLIPLNDFNERLEQLAAARTSTQSPEEAFLAEYEPWCQRNDPGTREEWSRPETDVAAWKTIAQPKAIEQVGLPGFDGIFWLRREIELPEVWATNDLRLQLGRVDDIDTTWVNGVRVGQMSHVNLNRVYTVPASALKPGKNIITVRVLDTGGDGGLIDPPDRLRLMSAKGAPSGQISLAGDWKIQTTAALNTLPSRPQLRDANNPNIVTVLYNGMIAPLLPYAIKGAIWYQGESNAERAYQYRSLLPAMIQDWRNRFLVGDFPFYIVQLAAWRAVNPEPRDNDWAELREAQALTARRVPHTGLAVALDIGDASDIHPKNKMEVGRRLALCALANTYGKQIEYSGPWYESMKTDGKSIRLTFSHADGLTAKGGPLKGFAIAGADHKFVWAEAVIKGDAIVVSSSEVPEPVAVRYAWDTNPVCNLYNKAGLPAVPFRTDDWPLTTRDRK